jgi:hypothetical protein
VHENILAAHPDDTYTFHARYVEAYFKGVFNKPGYVA